MEKHFTFYGYDMEHNTFKLDDKKFKCSWEDNQEFNGIVLGDEKTKFVSNLENPFIVYVKTGDINIDSTFYGYIFKRTANNKVILKIGHNNWHNSLYSKVLDYNVLIKPQFSFDNFIKGD